jgi:hypothetical protein
MLPSVGLLSKYIYEGGTVARTNVLFNVSGRVGYELRFAGLKVHLRGTREHNGR